MRKEAGAVSKVEEKLPADPAGFQPACRAALFSTPYSPEECLEEEFLQGRMQNPA